jgi:nitrite reductase/ring-hydroxylating ferredoxin subunit
VGGEHDVMRRRAVCAIEDLPPGTMKLVPVGKFGVGVYNINGSLYAIANYCAHEGAPLCAGFVGGTTEFDPDAPGRLRYVRDGRVVRCPWHQWEYDITTGRTVADPRKRVRTYEVDVMDGQVYLTA